MNAALRTALIAIVLCTAALVASSFGGTQPAQAARAHPSATLPTVTAPEAAMLKRINRYRTGRGLVALKIDAKLQRAAHWMSRDMAVKNYFSHTDSVGRDPFRRMAYFGYPADTYRGENIAAGYAGVEDTFQQWRNSAPHNKNMLTAPYRAIGIGLYSYGPSKYDYYWTTDFGSRVTQAVPVS